MISPLVRVVTDGTIPVDFTRAALLELLATSARASVISAKLEFLSHQLIT